MPVVIETVIFLSMPLLNTCIGQYDKNLSSCLLNNTYSELAIVVINRQL